MKRYSLFCRSARSIILFYSVAGTTAWAHGPVVVLNSVNGQIVTNQLDVTPQSDAASTSDYPLGTPSRVYPNQYNVSNYNTFSTGTYAPNQPLNMQAIPMTWITVSGDTTGNAGYYGQLEVTDAIGNNTLATGPGYAYGHGGFATGTVFQISFTSSLQYWNGRTFASTPNGEELQAIRGSSITPGTGFANTLTSNNSQGGTGLQVNVTASQNAGSHSQLMYRLEDNGGNSVEAGETKPTESQISDGLYLATFDIGAAATSSNQLVSSQPYYFLFDLDRDNDVPSAQVTAAVTYLNTAAGVPEPSSIAFVAVLGGALLARRSGLAERSSPADRPSAMLPLANRVY